MKSIQQPKSSKTLSQSRTLVGAVIGVLGIVGAARQQVWASDLTLRETIYNTDYASAGVGGLRHDGQGTIRLRDVTGTVSRAYLYWAGLMDSINSNACAQITVNGQSVTGASLGLSAGHGRGFEISHAYRADVTSLVATQGNGRYVLAGLQNESADATINGASLVVFFNDGRPGNNRDIVLFDGNDSNQTNPFDANGWNLQLTGLRAVAGPASVQLHVSDGQAIQDGALLLNGRKLACAGNLFQGTTVRPAHHASSSRTSLWDIKNFRITSFLAHGTNALTLTQSAARRHDGLALIAAVINLPAGAAPVADMPPVDMTAPVLNLSSNIVVSADLNRATAAVNYNVTATDDLPGVAVISRPPSGYNFPIGVTTVNATAVDAAGRITQGGFTVTVLDTQLPVIHVPENIVTAPDEGTDTATVNYIVLATDNSRSVDLVCSPPSGFAFPMGVTVVQCEARDAAGNIAASTFTVTVGANP